MRDKFNSVGIGNIVAQQADVAMGTMTCLHAMFWPKTDLRNNLKAPMFQKFPGGANH